MTKTTIAYLTELLDSAKNKLRAAEAYADLIDSDPDEALDYVDDWMDARKGKHTAELIAQARFGWTLERTGRDANAFHDVSAWGMEEALTLAFLAGVTAERESR